MVIVCITSDLFRLFLVERDRYFEKTRPWGDGFARMVEAIRKNGELDKPKNIVRGSGKTKRSRKSGQIRGG